jgi:hypothetical protein
VLEELEKSGVVVTLDRAGRAHFRSRMVPPPATRRMIEVHGDLVEAYLQATASESA